MRLLIRLVKRLTLAVPVLIAVTLLTFLAMNYLGDPLVNLLGPENDTREYVAARAAAEEQYHFDKPVIVRYGLWLKDMSSGDFGRSYSTQQSISRILKDKIPISVIVMIMAQLMALIIAIPWALWAASRGNSRLDKWSTNLSFVLIAVPALASGVIIYYIFAIRLGWFPSRYDGTSLASKIKSLFLPSLTLALGLAAAYQRLLRVDLLATLQEDFILTAKSKGLSKKAIMRKHALRPSMFSIITSFGINTASLIGGTVVVERIFSVPGVGNEIPEAVIRDDYSTVLAFVVIISVLFVVANIAVDVLYGALDPRVEKHG